MICYAARLKLTNVPVSLHKVKGQSIMSEFLLTQRIPFAEMADRCRELIGFCLRLLKSVSRNHAIASDAIASDSGTKFYSPASNGHFIFHALIRMQT